MGAIAILQPVFAMGLLTLAITIWMFVTRIPEMNRRRIDPQQAQDTSRLRDLLPPEIMRVSNNYNHLFEQPALFYAIAISIALLDQVDSLQILCAWAYVGLRVAHSLVQATVDIVMIRFSLFLLSWIALAIMIVRGALSAF